MALFKITNKLEYIKENSFKLEKEIPIVNEELSKHFIRKTFKERKENGEFVGRHRRINKENKQNPSFLFDYYEKKSE